MLEREVSEQLQRGSGKEVCPKSSPEAVGLVIGSTKGNCLNCQDAFCASRAPGSVCGAVSQRVGWVMPQPSSTRQQILLKGLCMLAQSTWFHWSPSLDVSKQVLLLYWLHSLSIGVHLRSYFRLDKLLIWEFPLATVNHIQSITLWQVLGVWKESNK